ncbi:hypothetical protein Rsub_00882 [Raphidocelis subcapitata]|uniref:Uncharacterized protein n=1 Tax=Raphidocelis subcapitata TaxID=307507 RepID=A0A2V0NRH8_9CHLO|nr:hypothetical protein Rsub_00882 [Raphidocelis subcapitata]|eukprot:GBF88170.1 hypothetical protein Rsub_00882 [Raphidocelis subcapitata]
MQQAAWIAVPWLLLLLGSLPGGAGGPPAQEARQRAPKEFNAVEAAKAYALEWRMEATAHIASLAVRDQHCRSDAAACDAAPPAGGAVEPLSKWAAADPGWDRMLSSVSLYEIARHAYQQAQHDEAIIALEESLALRLFAYADQATLDRWQQGLVLPGSLFRRQKMDLANILVLRSDCLVQLAQEQQDVDDLTEATELLNLATALLKAADELVPDSVDALRRRAETISRVAIDLLPRLKPSRVAEVLSHYGVPCPTRGARDGGCSSHAEGLARLVPLLRLPVSVAGSGASSRLVVPDDPFASHVTALLRRPAEHAAPYAQRLFFRLLTMVPVDYLAELDVACRKRGAGGRCISYLPPWVMAQAITVDRRTGLVHAGGPAAAAACGGGGGGGGGADDCGCCDGGGRARGAGRAGCSCGVKRGDGGSGAPPLGSGGGSDPEGGSGMQLCGFLHIRAIPPGVELPSSGGALTPEQQRLLQRKAAEGAAAAEAGRAGGGGGGSSSSSSSGGGGGGDGKQAPFQGVYYYYYADVPALVDRIVGAQDADESGFLLGQLDALSGARRLPSLGRAAAPPPPADGCTETRLLEGRAPPGCSVLLPNFGSCASAPLKPPRRRAPLPPPPAGLPLPPPRGSYQPQYRRRAPEARLSRLGDDDAIDALLGAAAAPDDDRPRGAGAAPPGGHARLGGGGAWGRGGRGLASAEREFADRQLQEQLAKLARDPHAGRGAHRRDDPLVPLTLAGCVAASVGLYLVSRRRRRGGAGGGGLAAAGGGLISIAGARARGGSGAGAGDGPGGGAAAPSESHLKQRAAAALRDAMAGSDAAKLDAAIEDAAALDLDPGLIQRARVMLSQRRKRERERAQAARERARAAKREAAKRQKHAAAAAVAAAPAPALVRDAGAHGGSGGDVGSRDGCGDDGGAGGGGGGGSSGRPSPRGIAAWLASLAAAGLGLAPPPCAAGAGGPQPLDAAGAPAAGLSGGGGGGDAASTASSSSRRSSSSSSSSPSSSRVSSPAGADTLAQSDAGDGSLRAESLRRLSSAFSSSGAARASSGGDGGRLVHAASGSTIDGSEDAASDAGWQEAAGPYKRKAARALQAQQQSLLQGVRAAAAGAARPPAPLKAPAPGAVAAARRKLAPAPLQQQPLRPPAVALATPPRTPPAAAPPPALDHRNPLPLNASLRFSPQSASRRPAQPAGAAATAPSPACVPAPAACPAPNAAPSAGPQPAAAPAGGASWLGWLGVPSALRGPAATPPDAAATAAAHAPPAPSGAGQRLTLAALLQQQQHQQQAGGGGGEPLASQQFAPPPPAARTSDAASGSATSTPAKRHARSLNPEAAPYQPRSSTLLVANGHAAAAAAAAGYALPFAPLLQPAGEPYPDADAAPFSARPDLGGPPGGAFSLPLFARARANSDFGGALLGARADAPRGPLLLPPLPPEVFGPGGAAAAAGGLLPALLPELGGGHPAASAAFVSPRHHHAHHHHAHHHHHHHASHQAALRGLPDTLFPGFRSCPSDDGAAGGGGGGGAFGLNLPDEPFGPHQPPASGGMARDADWPPPAPPPPPSAAAAAALFGPPGGLWGGGGGAQGGAEEEDESLCASGHGAVSAAEAELNRLAQDMTRGLVE